MNHQLHFTLTHRISEESQLQAEEKWIKDALAKIKAQRNCLQIERLQLESMKTQLKSSTNKNIAEAAKNHVQPAKAPTTFSISMAAPKPPSDVVPLVLTTPNRRLLEAEASCNMESLDLGVGVSMFNINPTQPFSIEEYEEEEEENEDDFPLDMNMFMNCAQKQQQ